DAELERRGRDQRAELPGLQPLLRVQPVLARQAAVMRGDRVLAEALGEMARDTLALAAVVGEDQRRPVPGDELGELVVQLAPHLVGHHRLARRARPGEGAVPRAPAAGVAGRA